MKAIANSAIYRTPGDSVICPTHATLEKYFLRNLALMRRFSISRFSISRFSISWSSLALFGTLMICPPVRANSVSTVSVAVDGLKNQRGQVCLSLYANAQGFPAQGQAAARAQCIKASTKPVSIAFRNLKPGNYAIALFHDANGNGKLDTNNFGIPKEGFGFSRNPRILMGAPKFSDAAFGVKGGNTNIQIRMKYFL